MSCYYIVISEKSTGRVVKKMGPIKTKRGATKIRWGVGINLNQNEFYAEIIKEEDEPALSDVKRATHNKWGI